MVPNESVIRTQTGVGPIQDLSQASFTAVQE